MSVNQLEWEQIKQIVDSGLPLKKRPVIIVQVEDEPHIKNFNAIIVRADENKKVWVRYLDNPQTDTHYWWTGNSNNKVGLNPQVYSAIFLGDTYDSISGISPEDFIEDGYDDIFDFNKESFRFMKGSKEYPYLSGKFGNIYTNQYFNEIHSRGYQTYFTPIASLPTTTSHIPSEIHGQLKNNPEIKRISSAYTDKLAIFEILSRHSSNFYPRHEQMNKELNKLKNATNNTEQSQSSQTHPSHFTWINSLDFMREFIITTGFELHKYRSKTKLKLRNHDFDLGYDFELLLKTEPNDVASITQIKNEIFSKLNDILKPIDISELLEAYGKKNNLQITLFDIFKNPEKSYEIEYYEYGNLSSTDLVVIYSFNDNYEEISI